MTTWTEVTQINTDWNTAPEQTGGDVYFDADLPFDDPVPFDGWGDNDLYWRERSSVNTVWTESS